LAKWEKFFCPNEACPDYGKKGKGNIRLKEYYGKQNTAPLRCKTCKKTFSENRGTPFFGLHTPKETILRSMAMLVEKGSIRGTARAMGVDKDSVVLWLKRAGEHCVIGPFSVSLLIFQFVCQNITCILYWLSGII